LERDLQVVLVLDDVARGQPRRGDAAAVPAAERLVHDPVETAQAAEDVLGGLHGPTVGGDQHGSLPPHGVGCCRGHYGAASTRGGGAARMPGGGPRNRPIWQTARSNSTEPLPG